jgi:hypothetical protein
MLSETELMGIEKLRRLTAAQIKKLKPTMKEKRDLIVTYITESHLEYHVYG